MSKKDKNQIVLANSAIEFQPDAIELANRKLPWWANLGVLWLFLLFVVAIVYASIYKVDVMVRCTGKIVSVQSNITMMPIERMIIEDINVREGDLVHKGDVLFVFDPTVNEADYVNYSELLAKAEPTYERLLAEFMETKYVPKDPNDRNQQIQQVLFEQRKRTYDSKVAYYDSAIKTTESQIASVKDSIITYENMIKEFDQTVQAYKYMASKGAIASLEQVQVEMNRISYEGTLTQYRNSLPTYMAQLASNQAERLAYIEAWREQVASDFNTAEQELTQYQQAMEKVKRYRDYYKIIAPCDAIVQEVAKYSRGSAVREAEPLISLVPVDAGYVVEIEIPAKDVSKVHLGQQVRVKLAAYPFQVWGTMEGKLTQISEDAFTRQQAQNMEVALTGNTYYRGWVTLDSGFKKEPDNYRLQPGLEATAEVITGQRRIITYIFHPLIKMLDESLREP